MSVEELNPCSFEVINYESILISSTKYSSILCQHFDKKLDSEVKVSGLVVYNGCDFRIGSLILIKYCSSSPIFGEIQQIIVENDQCNFIVNLVDSNYNAEKCSFEIEITNSTEIIDINSIAFYQPFLPNPLPNPLPNLLSLLMI